jgi:hypothetical protein
MDDNFYNKITQAKNSLQRLKEIGDNLIDPETMTTVDIWDLHMKNELHISIQNGDILNKKNFHFQDLTIENKKQMMDFITELKNHFGFKLEEKLLSQNNL